MLMKIFLALVIIPLNEYSTQNGSRLEVDCTILSFPVSQVVWIKNGMEIDSTQGFSNSSTAVRRLVIENVSCLEGI